MAKTEKTKFNLLLADTKTLIGHIPDMFQRALESFAAEATRRQILRKKDQIEMPHIETLSKAFRAWQRKYARRFLSEIKDTYTRNRASALAAEAGIDAYDLASWSAEYLTPGEIRAALNVVSDELNTELHNTFDAHDAVFVLGAAAFKELTDGAEAIPVSFDVANPRAVNYIRNELSTRITQIDDATKDIIDGLITQAILNGEAFSTASKRIRGVGGFDNELFGRDKNGHDRADRVAIFEVGDRYERGQFEMGQQFVDQGFEVKKQNLDAGDRRVSQEHRLLTALGLISLREFFGSTGRLHAPFRPNCRCATLYEVIT